MKHNRPPGLNVELDVSILYHIRADAARNLYLTLGENYQEVLIKPELASAVRGLTSEQSAKALYTSGRRMIQTNLKQELVSKFESRGIELDDVLLKAIVLPKMLMNASAPEMRPSVRARTSRPAHRSG